MKRHYGNEIEKIENMRKMIEKDIEIEENMGILCISFREKYMANQK